MSDEPIKIKTRDQVKQWLYREGITAVEFARVHGLKYSAVVDLLQGRLKGRNGEAHRAAKALGLK